MTTTSIPSRGLIHFEVSDRDPHPEQVMYALRGVALALDGEAYTVDELDRRQMERIEGLSAAALILAEWLTDRLGGVPAESSIARAA